MGMLQRWSWWDREGQPYRWVRAVNQYQSDRDHVIDMLVVYFCTNILSQRQLGNYNEAPVTDNIDIIIIMDWYHDLNVSLANYQETAPWFEELISIDLCLSYFLRLSFKCAVQIIGQIIIKKTSLITSSNSICYFLSHQRIIFKLLFQSITCPLLRYGTCSIVRLIPIHL